MSLSLYLCVFLCPLYPRVCQLEGFIFCMVMMPCRHTKNRDGSKKKNFFYVLTKVFCRINYLRLHWHYSKIFDTGPVTKITLNFRYRLRLENHILKAMCMKERKLNVTSLRNCVTFSYVILRNLRLNCMNRSIGWCMQFSSYNNKVRFRFEFRHQVYTLFAGHFPKPRE